ncbi:MAG: MBL fold metallo-hydrolase [Chloroflexi bacterium]|nr:MBL fold metallo-hydrolase [Chloroflexota bacterium]
MRRDRVAEDIFVFISEAYIQVTSTVVLTSDGAIVVDATPFPAEAREVLAFIKEKTRLPVRYVINTHHHADHVYGTFVFAEAEVIAQDNCRRRLVEHGQSALARAKAETPALAEVTLRLPDMTFQQEMRLTVGGQNMRLFHTPGHTEDGLSVYIEKEKVLVAGDVVMPVPYIVHGNRHELAKTLLKIKKLEPDFIIQGHGNVLLRGEVDETIDASMEYLRLIEERVQKIVRRGDPPSALRNIDIESCGLSRIPLDGMVSKLHLDNLIALYREFSRL